MKTDRTVVEAAAQTLAENHALKQVVVLGGRAGGAVDCRIVDRHGGRHVARLLPVRGALGIAGLGRVEGVAEGGPLIVVAEVVGPRLAAELVARGVGYVDAAGNCHVELDGGRILVHVEGRRRRALARRAGSLRAAGYRALFALLAEPELVGGTVRAIVAKAGASRHAVAELLARLRDEGFVARTGRTGHAWVPGRRDELVDRFAIGWADVLGAAQLVGRFRTRHTELAAVEEAVANASDTAGTPFGFGGGAGAARLLQYFRGADTVVHAADWTGEIERLAGAVPDRDGPLVVYATMGALDLAGPGDRTAHPLLLHAELARSDEPRARDAAKMLFDRYLQERIE